MFDTSKLESGMVVVLQNGGVYIVVGDRLMRNTGFIRLDEIESNGYWSICEVYDKKAVNNFDELCISLLDKEYLIYPTFDTSKPLKDGTLVALDFKDEFVSVSAPKTDFYYVKGNNLLRLLNGNVWKNDGFSKCSVNEILNDYMIERVRVFDKDNKLIYATKE